MQSKRIQIALLSTLAALTTVCTTATADDTRKPATTASTQNMDAHMRARAHTFSSVDSNRDGVVSSTELSNADRNLSLANIDHDRDGSISDKEWGRYSYPFRSVDTNGDGMVSDAELDAAGSDFELSAIDSDRNGNISSMEWSRQYEDDPNR